MFTAFCSEYFYISKILIQEEEWGSLGTMHTKWHRKNRSHILTHLTNNFRTVALSTVGCEIFRNSTVHIYLFYTFYLVFDCFVLTLMQCLKQRWREIRINLLKNGQIRFCNRDVHYNIQASKFVLLLFLLNFTFIGKPFKNYKHIFSILKSCNVSLKLEMAIN